MNIDVRVKEDNVSDDLALAHPAMVYVYADPINSNRIVYAIEGNKILAKDKDEETNQAKDLHLDVYYPNIVLVSQKDTVPNGSIRVDELYSM